MPLNKPDPTLDPLKTDLKQLAIRAYMHAKYQNISILKRLIEKINNSNTSLVLKKIRAEVGDILMEIDMGNIDSPDDYFEAILRR